jgi:hypothetical protein
LLDTSCKRFWLLISIIFVSRIHKNTVMSGEHIVILQSVMQFLQQGGR